MASAIFILITQIFFTLNRQKMVSIRMAEHRSLAVRAADGELDRARALTLAEVDALEGKSFPVYGLPGLDDSPGAIQVRPEEGHPGLRRITIRVEWTGDPGRQVTAIEMSAILRPRVER